ncbi:uroporphyrinogen decarboxylase [Sporolactobacillus sp. Y61]|uniref:Uroporphyrinogen decarboxylase n=1 Tax=Sporolactobacillus sp. Y61 TaxID=3160863 RepID=A0AAU8IC37_9BACL|nr:uroporphyrinogen decarboxylase [Sporolactobacillus sp. THM19-2]RYL86511.1 uroporphyrinogen decarboxylase [Sporolactobacillus sp. THM19-2]
MKPVFHDTFLKACRQEPVSRIPVWYMRQAGRYQAEYRVIRAQHHNFFDLCRDPELCARVTRLPVEHLGVDAAILFSDIMTPLKARGLDVELVEGTGPVIRHPFRRAHDLSSLRTLDPDRDLQYVIETVKLLHSQLSVPLIGFAGAPFTLASYMIEGGPSKNYHLTKGFMYTHPDDWQALMEDLAAMTVSYLKAQIAAGAQAVQVFDSWVGALGAEDYRTFIAPVMRNIFTALRQTDAVTLYFAAGAGHLLKEWDKLPVDVLSFDWRTSPQFIRGMHLSKAVQGNLDPSMLLAPFPLLKERTRQILDVMGCRPGFIFNLGHGLFPEVDEQQLKRLTDFIHQYPIYKERSYEDE